MMNKNKFFSIASAVVGILLMTTSCEEDNTYESQLPAFDHVSLASSAVAPGDKVKATIYFAYEGSYIKGTYQWNVSNSENGTIAIGEVATGAVKEQEFTVAIPENAEAGTYTLTVKPSMMAAFAGKDIYLDYSPMGEVRTRLTITNNNQPEE